MVKKCHVSMVNEAGNKKASPDAALNIFVQPIYTASNDDGHDDIQQISSAVSISTVRAQRELGMAWPGLALLVEISCATFRECCFGVSTVL
jgi:hypothetical protein